MKKQHANAPRAMNVAPPTVPPTMAPTLVESCPVCPDRSWVDVDPDVRFVTGEEVGEEMGEGESEIGVGVSWTMLALIPVVELPDVTIDRILEEVLVESTSDDKEL